MVVRKNLHCLALVSDAYGGRGGIAQYNRDFLGALAASGHFASVRVLPRQAPRPFATPEGVIQASPPKYRARYALAAVVMALRTPVDVVFCGHVHLAPLAAFIAWLRRARMILQVHGIEIWTRPSRLRRNALEKSDLVFCVSRHTRAVLLASLNVVPERVLVLPNTVGDIFVPGDRSAFRNGIGIGENEKILLTVGRLDARERYKGHDRVIAILPSLLAQGHDIVYVIVGGGDDRPRLEYLARHAGVANRVRFAGEITPERLTEAYRSADLFVMPSTGEGFGISFLEAMASGTPALGLAVAGATDALADGALGTAVDEDDLSAAIGRLLEAKREPRDLSAAVRARFGPEIFAGNVRRALDRLTFP
jgi:phosphatidylinositol alpha-1,6-mannosyltransferase